MDAKIPTDIYKLYPFKGKEALRNTFFKNLFLLKYNSILILINS